MDYIFSSFILKAEFQLNDIRNTTKKSHTKTSQVKNKWASTVIKYNPSFAPYWRVKCVSRCSCTYYKRGNHSGHISVPKISCKVPNECHSLILICRPDGTFMASCRYHGVEGHPPSCTENNGDFHQSHVLYRASGRDSIENREWMHPQAQLSAVWIPEKEFYII